MKNSPASLAWLLAGVLAAPVAAQEAEAKPPATKQLIERLGDDGYKVRRDAEEQLRQRGDAVLDELRKAAEEHRDPEVRWRAERLLRAIERGGDDGDDGSAAKGGLRPRRPGQEHSPGRGADLDRTFESLFEQLERDFGLDVPRQRFFGDPFFRDLDQQMKAMRERMNSGIGSFGAGQSTAISVGPDGVEVRVQERGDDGVADTKTYRAPDMETFREQYPDIAKRYFDADGARIPGLRGLVPRPPAGQRVVPRRIPLQPRPPEGPVLGVRVRELGADLRGFLGLAPGQGLLVEEVVADTLAERLEVRRGDVLLEVNGASIGTAADVGRALRSNDEDETEVVVNRRGEQRTLRG